MAHEVTARNACGAVHRSPKASFWSDAELHARMLRGWKGGLADGTPCGSGSTLNATAVIRAWLPEIFKLYAIESVCDAGAGDLRWHRHSATFDAVDYRAFDFVPRHPLVAELDVTKQAPPACDAILCRHVLIHLDPPRIEATLALFKRSAMYLIASQYPDAPAFNPAYDYNPTDLRPQLGAPLRQCRDTNFPGTFLAIWRLT